MCYLLLTWIALFFNLFEKDNTLLLNYVSYFLWLCTLIYILRKDYIFSLFSLPVLFSFTVTAISCLFSEQFNVYFSEIQVWASLTGATARVLSLCAFIVLSAFITFRLLTKIKTIDGIVLPKKVNNILLYGIEFIFILSVILLFIIFILYGSPNTYGVDRFYYWNNIAPKWAEYVKFSLSQLIIFIGMLYSLTKTKRYLFIFILSLIVQMLVGEKFTGLFMSTMVFFIPIVIFNKINLLKKFISFKFIFLLSIFCLLLFLSIVILAHEDTKNANMLLFIS